MAPSLSGARQRVWAAKWPWLCAGAVLLLALLSWGVHRIYHEREDRRRHQVEQELQAISQLQAQSVADWREQRLTDARALSDDTLLATTVRQWMQTHDPRLEQHLRERLRILEERAQYTAAYLVDTQGRQWLTARTAPSGELPTPEMQMLQVALSQAEPAVLDPRFSPSFAFPFYSLIAPVFDGDAPLGAIWLVSDVRSTLYQLLTSWPIANSTAESVIVTRSEDDVVLLSPSKAFGPMGPQARLPMRDTQHPAVQAAAGVRGVIYTTDRANTPVIAMLRAVPDSSWNLVTTLPLSEVFAEARQREMLAISLTVSLGLLCAGLGFSYWQRRAWQRELALKNDLQRNILWLENAQRAAAIGYFSFDRDRSVFTTSSRVTSIFGLPPSESLPTADWVRRIHPEDKAATLQIHQKAFDDRASLHCQYRIVRANDQAVRWVEVWADLENAPHAAHRLIGTVQDITERRQSEDRLAEHRAQLEEHIRRDPLTHLANRRGLDERLVAEWNRAMRNESPLSLLMIDVDHFKSYNDHYGHLAGDLCLQKVASVIANAVLRAGDMVARYGGEEFVVLLPDTDEYQALTMARKVGAAVRARSIEHAHTGGAPWITVSIGVATVQPRFESPEGNTDRDADTPRGGGHPGLEMARVLFAHADAALYQAKLQGRNCAVVFTANTTD